MPSNAFVLKFLSFYAIIILSRKERINGLIHPDLNFATVVWDSPSVPILPLGTLRCLSLHFCKSLTISHEMQVRWAGNCSDDVVGLSIHPNVNIPFTLLRTIGLRGVGSYEKIEWFCSRQILVFLALPECRSASCATACSRSRCGSWISHFA